MVSVHGGYCTYMDLRIREKVLAVATHNIYRNYVHTYKWNHPEYHNT